MCVCVCEMEVLELSNLDLSVVFRVKVLGIMC